MRKTIVILGLSTVSALSYNQLTEEQRIFVDEAKLYQNSFSAEDFKDQFEKEEELEQFVNTMSYNEYVRAQKRNDKAHLNFVEFVSAINEIKEDRKVEDLNDQAKDIKLQNKKTRGLK